MIWKYLIAVLLISSPVFVTAIDPDRVFLVDRVGKNFLFRTNTPVVGDTLKMDTLQEIMSQKLAAQGLSFPENPKMISFSFIWPKDQKEQNYVEDHYFEDHPEYEYTLYPLHGSSISPNSLPSFIRNAFAKYYTFWNQDKLNVLTKKIRNYLEVQEEKPKVIFFHCLAGQDRTGEAFGAYTMRYMNWTYQQALDYDNKVQPRKIHDTSKNGMNWFCYYLNQKENKGGDCSYEPNY